MNINFLNGNLVIRENKSGVHFFHENIMKGLIKENVEFKSSFFNFNNKKSELLSNESYRWLNGRIIQCKYLHRILTYILPIELFFGSSDIYICDGWIPITLHKSKKIAIVHDLMSKIYRENYKLIMKIYLNIYFRQIKKADIIVAVSETTKYDIIKYLNISADKIKVIYNGVDMDYISNSIPNEVDDEINLSKKYILYIGEMRKNKNLISAIKAFEMYCDRNLSEEIYFYIGGKKAFEYENIKKYIKGKRIEKRVVFLGYVSEKLKIQLYKNAFAFIFVSLYEGFGIPILEAMACKIPVITSNCSSMKEIASNSALLVSPENIEEICSALEILSESNVRNALIEKGIRCAEKYSWHNSVLQFKNILKNYSHK